jgi:hypothetical protein
MPNSNDPQKPPPDPAKGTGTGSDPIPIPGKPPQVGPTPDGIYKPPQVGPTPDGIYKPPQTRKVVAAPAAGVIGAMFGALIGVVCRVN